jgi:hypothetical protein
MDQATDQIGVGGSPALPLAVHLDEHHVVAVDQAFRSPPPGKTRRRIEVNPVVGEEIEK